MSKAQEHIRTLKAMIYKARSPKMDSSSNLDLHEAGRLLTKINIGFEELEKKNEELKDYTNILKMSLGKSAERCIELGNQNEALKDFISSLNIDYEIIIVDGIETIKEINRNC